MDRTGKISLSIIGAATALVAFAGCGTDEKPAAPKPTAITETASPAFKSPAPPRPDAYGDGDYIIGDDIPYGTYTSPGAKDDVFDLCIVSSTSEGAKHWPILKSANTDDRIIVRLSKDNAGDVLSISGCKSLQRRG